MGIIVNRNNQQKEELKNNLESDVQSALQYAETWWKNNEYQFGEEEEVEKTIQDLINENYIETDEIVDECGLDDKKNENGQCYGITNELNSKSINNLKLRIYVKNNEVYSCIINDDYNNEILGNDFDYSSLYCKDEDNNSDNQTNEENDNSDIDKDDSTNEEIKYGDVNNDNKITTLDANIVNRYITGEAKLTEKEIKNADVNGDKKINATDVYLLKAISSKIYTHNLTSPLTNYVIYGDVNNAGKINVTDSSLITRYISGSIVLEDKQSLKNADVNGDGKITADDSLLIKEYVAGQHRDKLPLYPVK